MLELNRIVNFLKKQNYSILLLLQLASQSCWDGENPNDLDNEEIELTQILIFKMMFQVILL